LASPSDLKPERELAREVVNTLNASIREINWFVELLGWEDTLPGSGRPQSLINADIEQCQLFVGLLWRRWGTPPDAAGEYTSGFEEEFQLARRLQQTNGIPNIWMFFKQVELDQLRDPGAQLQRVQRFREEIAQQRACLFKEFADPQQWKQQLAELLLRHVLRIHNARKSPQEAVQAQAQSPVSHVTTHSGAVAAPAAGHQIEAFAKALAPCFRTADLRDIETREFVTMSFFAAEPGC